MSSNDGISIGIVGAGFGGLAAAIELQRSGIENYTVLERGDAVGGVWRDNTYPGAQCDVPSSIYSYSFELDHAWSQRFGTQPEILGYLERCARKFGVYDKIRFGTEVVSAQWRADEGRWNVELASGEELAFHALVCAPGQLSNPKIPNVPGLDDFAGEQFHSARWRHDVDLTGKRVAVVGGGASAIQVVPAIADDVAQLTSVQRSPSWVVDKHNHRTTRLGRLAKRALPGVSRMLHNIEWLWFESRYLLVLNAFDPLRPVTFEAWTKLRIGRALADRAERAKVVPDYKLGCNRVLASHDWYPTLARDHVDVHTAGVAGARPDGIVLQDGTEVPADVIVWCTGFDTDHFLGGVRITGRDGRVLADEWSDGAEAHLGITVSGFPNLFMLYGPNTGSLTNTIIFLLEKQAAYIRQAVTTLAPGEAYDVHAETQARYNARLQQRLSKTVFTSGCPGWYTNAAGKVVAVWPGTHTEYARAVARFDADDYEHLPARTPAAAA